MPYLGRCFDSSLWYCDRCPSSALSPPDEMPWGVFWTVHPAHCTDCSPRDRGLLWFCFLFTISLSSQPLVDLDGSIIGVNTQELNVLVTFRQLQCRWILTAGMGRLEQVAFYRTQWPCISVSLLLHVQCHVSYGLMAVGIVFTLSQTHLDI